MIEVLKQSAEDVSKVYDILAFGHTERALEILAKTRTSLRQAIAEAEKQSHPMMNMPHDQMVAMAYGYPPQRKPLTDEQIATISVECATVSPSDIYFARAIEAAHGIKE